ncbi:MAG: CDP-alcohol phosphatidyltransferase family protein [Promethearchaeota archaeon]|jgi:phosphatidylglycerophosphate synthase
MIDKWLLKTRLNQVLENFVKKLLSNRISANQITIIGFCIGVLSALFIYLSGQLIWDLEFVIVAVVFMLISFFFDTIDGALARLEEPTVFGGILDIFCDRAVEISILISIVSTNSVALLWPGLFSLASIILCITMFLLVGGAVKPENLEDKQKVVYYRHGLMERSETLIFLFLMVVLIPFRFIILWIFFGLVLITALLRLKDAYSIFKEK